MDNLWIIYGLILQETTAALFEKKPPRLPGDQGHPNPSHGLHAQHPQHMDVRVATTHQDQIFDDRRPGTAIQNGRTIQNLMGLYSGL